MSRKFSEESKGGLPGWLATYGDLATLLLCFFVLLFSMSSIDVAKYKAAVSSFDNQIDVMPGGIALTGEELITNGVNQLGEIKVILEDNNLKKSDEENEEDPTESNTEPNTNTGENVEEMTATEEISKDILEVLAETQFASVVTVTFSDSYAQIELEGEALFASGKAKVRPEAIELLNSIAQVIVDNGYDQYFMEIEGHTDNVAMNTVQFPNNWYLSSARAIAVGEIFIDSFAFNPELISCIGYGEFRPIADNSTVEGRASNRRVEIRINIDNKNGSVPE